MKRIILLLSMVVAIGSIRSESQVKAQNKAQADWLIVGGGPAGIITIGVLMDIGIDAQRIVWVDPEFNIGRMGKFYERVESNNKAKEFVAFINACATFQECPSPTIDALKNIDPELPCSLESVVEPLRCISEYLRTRVVTVQDIMTELLYHDDMWHVATAEHGSIAADHVVLATGACPRTLNLSTYQTVIPLDYALDPETLEALVDEHDIIGIIGGAHSAILLLKYLSEMEVKHVYNFYRHPITYAINQGCWAKDQLGVKGSTGVWAQEILEKNPPAHITRIKYEALEQLPSLFEQYHCNKLIYAVGYQRNPLPALNNTTPIDSYDAETGVIAPGLFGIGIAFPEQKADDGVPRYVVGLNCFMDYAQRKIPQWAQSTHRSRVIDQKKLLEKLESLITISVL